MFVCLTICITDVHVYILNQKQHPLENTLLQLKYTDCQRNWIYRLLQNQNVHTETADVYL